MPAERSRGSRRTEADGNQLVWTMPVEPSTPSGISFTTAITPTTFSEPSSPEPSGLSDRDQGPPPLAPFPTTTFSESFIYQVHPDGTSSFVNSSSSGTRKTSHSKKKPSNHIPRPPNAFILFRSAFIKSQNVSSEVETNHSTLSKIIGMTWKDLPEAERQFWHEKAKVALDEHKLKFPQYAFRPQHTKGRNGLAHNHPVDGLGPDVIGGQPYEKRRVREVEPKDEKRCAKIAKLLVAGKKGKELDEAIQEFDKTHVKEKITRFEAPLTEKEFQSKVRRRACSVGEVEALASVSTQPFLRQTSEAPSPAKKVKKQHSESRLPLPMKPALSLPNLVIPSPIPLHPSESEQPKFDVDFSSYSYASPSTYYDCSASQQSSGVSDYDIDFATMSAVHSYSPMPSIPHSSQGEMWDQYASSQSTTNSCSTPITPGYQDAMAFMPSQPQPVYGNMVDPHVYNNGAAEYLTGPLTPLEMEAMSLPVTPISPIIPPSYEYDYSSSAQYCQQPHPMQAYGQIQQAPIPSVVSPGHGYGPFSGLDPISPCEWQLNHVDIGLEMFMDSVHAF